MKTFPFNELQCPLEQCPEDGTLVIRGTDIKASYIVEQLGSGVSPTKLMAQHKEITPEVIAFTLFVAAKILEFAPVEVAELPMH